MTVYVFAGPIGSGKSSIIPSYIEEHQLEDVEYICPALYSSELFSSIINVSDRNNAAYTFAKHKRERLLSEGKPMIIETMLSSRNIISFLENAHTLGYKIISVFVGTDSPQLNIMRVNKQTTESHQTISPNRICQLYYCSMKNLKALSQVSDELYVFDNTPNSPHLVSASINHTNSFSNNVPEWAKNI